VELYLHSPTYASDVHCETLVHTGRFLAELSLAVHRLGAGPMSFVCFLSGQLNCSLVTGLLVILVFVWIIGYFFLLSHGRFII
jgi:hypothetical protein